MLYSISTRIITFNWPLLALLQAAAPASSIRFLLDVPSCIRYIDHFFLIVVASEHVCFVRLGFNQIMDEMKIM